MELADDDAVGERSGDDSEDEGLQHGAIVRSACPGIVPAPSQCGSLTTGRIGPADDRPISA
jgi:hypothetical protein